MTIPSKRSAWIVLLAVLFLHTLAISFQANRRIRSGFIRERLIDTLAPVQQVLVMPFDAVETVWGRYIALLGVRSENGELRAEIDRLRMELQRRNEAVVEAGRLRSLLALKDAVAGRSLAARVIGRDPTRFYQTITLDRGSAHGVAVDSAVLIPEGIIGRVIHVSGSYCIVQLIADTQSGLGVIMGAARRQGVVRGTGGGELEVEFVDDDNDIDVGDPVVTAGTDGIYPKGLPVGTVSYVGERQSQFREMRIRPAADLSRLEEVLVLLDRLELPETDLDTGRPPF